MARLLRSGRGCSGSSCDGDRRRRSRRVQQHDDSSRSVRECSNKKGEKKREQREQSVCPGPVRLSVCSVRPCARAIQTLSFPFLSFAFPPVDDERRSPAGRDGCGRKAETCGCYWCVIEGLPNKVRDEMRELSSAAPPHCSPAPPSPFPTHLTKSDRAPTTEDFRHAPLQMNE
jgi:hypothetical protein